MFDLPYRLVLECARALTTQCFFPLLGWATLGLAFVGFPPSQSLAADPVLGKLNVHWLEDRGFWYLKPTGSGRSQFVWVDPSNRQVHRAGSLEELEKLASVPLTKGTGTGRIVPSETLDEARIEIEIKNRTDQSVELFWIDFQGSPKSYGRLSPGESRGQSTFTGHTWAASIDGKKPIWVGQTASKGQVLEIQIMEIESDSLFPRRNGRRTAPNRSTEDFKTGDAPANPWQVDRSDHQLRFRNSSGQIVLDTEALSQAKGSPSSRYDQPIFWSADRQFAFTLQTEQGDHREVVIVESSPRDQLQPKTKTIRYDKPGDKLDQPIPRLFDLQNAKLVPLDPTLFANPWSIEQIRWDQDPLRLTFLYNQRGHQILRLIAIDPLTGSVSSLIEEASPTYIDYAAKSYKEWFRDHREILWGSERDGWYHLYRYSAKDGELLNQVTSGPWVVRRIEKVDPSAGQIWFYAGGVAPGQDPYYRHLCRVDFDGQNFIRLTQGDGDHTVEFSPDGKWLIDTYSRVDMPPVHEVRSAQNGELVVELERSSTEGLWTDSSQPIRFSAKGRDGTTDIYGILVRPRIIEPGKKYPVIENIYAGPQDSFVPKAYSALSEYHALADQGFVVVKIDGMGTSNRSKAFHDVSYRNLSDGGFPDRILWMQQAAREYPEMDLEHVGIYGGSAGGQNALAALLFFGDFYDAAVADCGCHDNRMDKVWWNELYMGWPIGPHYETNSNVVNAHKLKGHLQLVVGELDTNVDPASTIQVVDALVRADKDFELLLIPGGGHGIGSSPYCKRRRDEFFRRHLQVAK
ncbi:MAG: prolyl oligopeptidase family serine peptidase [Planctomycetota bacterium]|jgi:dipeptidyl-peptidase-4